MVPNDSRRASTYIASALDPTINVAKTCKLARDALIVQFTPYRFPYVFSIPVSDRPPELYENNGLMTY